MTKKKVGRKKKLGQPIKKGPEIESIEKMREIIDYMTLGDINPETGAYKKLTLGQACKKVGVCRQSFYYYINRYPYIQKMYESFKQVRLLKIKDTAEDNLSKALKFKGSFSDMKSTDVAKLSLDILKQTDSDYSNKISLETKTEVNFSESAEDILRKIKELEAL